MYEFLNGFFFVFHTVFTLFNVVGWGFGAARRWHLLTVVLTALSWFGLGIWYGWGYCLCTDWHYRVRAHLGYEDQQGSYIRFLIYKLTGAELDARLVDTATLTVFLACAALSIGLNIRDFRRRRTGGQRAF